MGLVDYLGLIGTAVGGPLGGAVGGALSRALGGGNEPATPVASMGATQAPTQSPTRLNQLLQQQAFIRGFQDAAQMAPQGGETFDVASLVEGYAGRQPGTQKQQTGGRTGVPGGETTRRPLGYGGEGAGAGEGRGAGGASTSTTPPQTWGEEDAYRKALLAALQGQSALPQPAYQSAIARGQAAVNQQTQGARTRLQEALASRGLSQSGILSSGLADVERGRLGALSTLYGGLEEQNLAAQRAAQQNAMALYSAERESALNRALQTAMQQRQISASEPSWADYFGSLAGAAAGYLAPRTDYSQAIRDALSGLIGGSTPTTSDPYGALFGGAGERRVY